MRTRAAGIGCGKPRASAREQARPSVPDDQTINLMACYPGFYPPLMVCFTKPAPIRPSTSIFRTRSGHHPKAAVSLAKSIRPSSQSKQTLTTTFDGVLLKKGSDHHQKGYVARAPPGGEIPAGRLPGKPAASSSLLPCGATRMRSEPRPTASRCRMTERSPTVVSGSLYVEVEIALYRETDRPGRSIKSSSMGSGRSRARLPPPATLTARSGRQARSRSCRPPARRAGARHFAGLIHARDKGLFTDRSSHAIALGP
jgi:hypothetical protein